MSQDEKYKTLQITDSDVCLIGDYARYERNSKRFYYADTFFTIEEPPRLISTGYKKLVFAGDGKQLSEVVYNFHEGDTSLYFSSVVLKFRNNKQVKKELIRFMKKKYGDYFDETDYANSKELIWDKPEVRVRLTVGLHEVSVGYGQKRETSY